MKFLRLTVLLLLLQLGGHFLLAGSTLQSSPAKTAAAPSALPVQALSSVTGPLPVPAPENPAPVDPDTAQFVREMRADPSFRLPTDRDWSQTLSDLHAKSAEGDPRASQALLIAPEYLAFQKQISANPAPLSDADALHLFDLGFALLAVAMPADRAPLTDLEALSIQLYTNTTYGVINGDLAATNEKPVHYKTFIKTLDHALTKLPLYTGTVYHVQKMSAEDLANLKVGPTYHYLSYLSTSSERIGWQGNAVMVIQSKSGRVITNYSINPQEHEILMPHGVEMKLVTPPQLVNGVYLLQYQEIVPAPKPPEHHGFLWF